MGRWLDSEWNREPHLARQTSWDSDRRPVLRLSPTGCLPGGGEDDDRHTKLVFWARGRRARGPMMGVDRDIPVRAHALDVTPLMRAQRGSTRAARAWVKQWQASHGPPQYRAPGWCASHCSAARCADYCTRQQDIPLVLLQLSSTPARALLTHEKWMRTWWTLNPEHHCRSKPRPVRPASAARPAD